MKYLKVSSLRLNLNLFRFHLMNVRYCNQFIWVESLSKGGLALCL